jgi:hypothetical protein
VTSSGFLSHGFFVGVERAVKFDRDGVPQTPDVADLPQIGRCGRGQSRSTETVDGEQVVVTTDQLLCDDVDADVQPTDVLVLPDGTRWQVAGDVVRARSPLSGWAPGCVIPIKRASGAAQPQPVEE